MRIHHYFAIGLKIFALVLFIYGVTYAAPLIELYTTGNVNGLQADVSYYAINLALIIFVAAYLWLFPVSTSKWFLGAQQNQEVVPLPKQDTLAIFIIAIGLYVFAWGIVDIVYWASYLYIGLKFDPSAETLSPESKANIVATIIQLVLGMGLILKSKTLSAEILKVAN